MVESFAHAMGRFIARVDCLHLAALEVISLDTHVRENLLMPWY